MVFEYFDIKAYAHGQRSAHKVRSCQPSVTREGVGRTDSSQRRM